MSQPMTQKAATYGLTYQAIIPFLHDLAKNCDAEEFAHRLHNTDKELGLLDKLLYADKLVEGDGETVAEFDEDFIMKLLKQFTQAPLVNNLTGLNKRKVVFNWLFAFVAKLVAELPFGIDQIKKALQERGLKTCSELQRLQKELPRATFILEKMRFHLFNLYVLEPAIHYIDVSDDNKELLCTEDLKLLQQQVWSDAMKSHTSQQANHRLNFHYAKFTSIASVMKNNLPKENIVARWFRRAVDFVRRLSDKSNGLSARGSLDQAKALARQAHRYDRDVTGRGLDEFNIPKYETTLRLNRLLFFVYDKWTPIEDVELGTIAILSGHLAHNDKDELNAHLESKGKNLGVNVRMKEDHEVMIQGSDDAITNKEWRDSGVEVVHIKMKDRTADVSVIELDKAIDIAYKHYKDTGGIPMFECNRGKGRSHLGLLCYLSKHFVLPQLMQTRGLVAGARVDQKKLMRAIIHRARTYTKQRRLAVLSDRKKAKLTEYIETCLFEPLGLQQVEKHVNAYAPAMLIQ